MISSQGTKLVALQSSFVLRSITRTTSHVVSLDLSYNNLADLSPELLAAAARKVKASRSLIYYDKVEGLQLNKIVRGSIYLPDLTSGGKSYDDLIYCWWSSSSWW